MKIDTVEKIGFAAEGNSLNGSNVDEMGVSGIHALWSNYTAIGNLPNSSNLDIATGSEVAADESAELIIKVGDRVRDVLSGFKGTVVDVEGDKVWFTTYEMGKLWRHSNLVDVIG